MWSIRRRRRGLLMRPAERPALQSRAGLGCSSLPHLVVERLHLVAKAGGHAPASQAKRERRALTTAAAVAAAG